MEIKTSNQEQSKTTLNDSFYKRTGWHLSWRLVVATLLLIVLFPSILLLVVLFDVWQ